MLDSREQEALVCGQHNNPFAVLGLHHTPDGRVVRTLQPGATAVDLIQRNGDPIAAMRRIHDGGLFEAPMPSRKRSYALRITWESGLAQVIEDPVAASLCGRHQVALFHCQVRHRHDGQVQLH